ncbi:MAG: NADH-quinone oxidoreductase subunit C [Euzebyales bacterium]|nr:NADH-quinone oxidoreductase subunit C [Euzebyales bacterium]
MTDPTVSRKTGGSASDERPTGAGPGRSTEDMHAGEHAQLRGAQAELAVQLSDQLKAVRERIVTAFDVVETLGFRGELTVVVAPEQLVDLLTFCRDEPDLRCELLADLSGVHWPGGTRTESAQETTGWPSYAYGESDGRIEVDYILYSLTHGHRFRLRVDVPDVDPVLPSAAAVYGSANFMEREVYDFFGVRFSGHPDLRRILMPEEWDGHPHRKDYPLGGVEVEYKGATVPPPDERHY